MTRIKQSAAKFVIKAGVSLGLAVLALPVPAQAPAAVVPASNFAFSFDHATLSVANLDKEIAWYENVLGLKVTDREKKNDSFEVAELKAPGIRVDMSFRKGSVRNRIARADMDQGWAHVVYAAPDLEADYKKLTALNVEVREDRRKDATILRLFFHDAEGNEITIKKLDPSATPADNPLHISPDHLSLSVGDMDKEVDWYERALGFKLTGRVGGPGDTEIISHVAIGGNLMDITWNKGSVRHAVLKGDMEQGWHHMVFNAPDLDAVYSQLLAQHAEVRAEKDKNSKIILVSVNDPEGNAILFQPSR